MNDYDGVELVPAVVVAPASGAVSVVAAVPVVGLVVVVVVADT